MSAPTDSKFKLGLTITMTSLTLVGLGLMRLELETLRKEVKQIPRQCSPSSCTTSPAPDLIKLIEKQNQRWAKCTDRLDRIDESVMKILDSKRKEGQASKRAFQPYSEKNR